jgi:hypothetical protein
MQNQHIIYDYSNEQILYRLIMVKNEYKAKSIIKQLDASNNKLQTFIELQKAYSIPVNGKPTNQNNGNWTNSTAMNPFMGNHLFSLNPGEYFDTPLSTSVGYAVCYLEKKVTKQQFRELKSEYNQKELNRIASYETDYIEEHNKLVKEFPKRETTYIQPYNKKQSCKIWMGYSEGNAYFEEDSYKISWDGKCKNGYASGLGREIESADMMDKWGIAIYKQGKPTYYVTKDNLSDVLFEGVQDVSDEDTLGVLTTIKEKNNDIDVRTIAVRYEGKTHITHKSHTSPFWNGTYIYSKEYLSFGYGYQNYMQNDMNNKMDFEFVIRNKDAVNNGWVIAKQKNSTSLITGEFIDGKFKQLKLPQSYNQKSDEILREIKRYTKKSFSAQEQAQKVKKQYLKRICKDSVKVKFMDNNEYKEICSNKKEFAVMQKINDKLNKISEEKIARLEKQKFNEQQQKEEQHRQEMLSMERNRLSEIQRHNMAAEAQADADHRQQGWKNLTDQINNMTPKTYNVNHMGSINMYHY